MFAPSIDDRYEHGHRFRRGDSVIDVAAGDGVVDVLMADHPAPKVVEQLRGRRMIAIEGGTQALRRTRNAHLEIVPGMTTTVSVPSAFGAAILKAAAYETDSRDKDRHLRDAALLLAVIEDPYAERAGFAGSDRRRVQILRRALPPGAREWLVLPEPWQTDGQVALGILAG